MAPTAPARQGPSLSNLRYRVRAWVGDFVTNPQKPSPRRGPGACKAMDWRMRSEPVEDLVGPEALEPVQRLVQRGELVGADAADLLHRAHVLLIEVLDDVAHLAAAFGQTDPHRATVHARALMIEEAHLDELLQIVGDVGAEIV